MNSTFVLSAMYELYHLCIWFFYQYDVPGGILVKRSKDTLIPYPRSSSGQAPIKSILCLTFSTSKYCEFPYAPLQIDSNLPGFISNSSRSATISSNPLYFMHDDARLSEIVSVAGTINGFACLITSKILPDDFVIPYTSGISPQIVVCTTEGMNTK